MKSDMHAVDAICDVNSGGWGVLLQIREIVMFEFDVLFSNRFIYS